MTLLLAAAVCLGVIAAFIPSALAFSDVTGADVAEAVEVLSGLGIVSGYSDGSYHPDDALTRAQFCKLAILTEGHGDQARGSAYRTRFSDVPGGGWAAPYINLACEEGLVAGYGDGRFGPDDPVTVGQAVTVVLRLLGYTAEEIGPFWPEDYLNKAGALGLLDGLPADGGAGLTRGDAALLLYRVLRQTDRDGQDYIDNLCASKVTGAVLLDNNAEAADGTLGTVEVYANQTISWYEPAEAVPDRLVGRKGALLLDEAGKAVVYREFDAPDLTIGQAARAVLEQSEGEDIELVLAPPDLWNRSQESGRSRAQLFSEAGLVLTRSSRDFAAGCAAMKEWLAPGQEGAPAMTLGDVPNLWRCLARIHDLTHDVDSLRYFCVWWKNPAAPGAKAERAVWEPDLYEDYENADEEGKAYLLRRYGDPWG